MNENKVRILTLKQAREAFPLAKPYANAAKMNRVEWLKTRRSGIGGSEVAGLLGLVPEWSSPYKIWADKTSDEPPVNKSTEQTEAGSYLEPAIRQMIADRSEGKVFIVPQMLRSKVHVMMCADLDGVELLPNGEWRGIEIKTYTGFDKDMWENGVPTKYVTQIQHYMAVTGLKSFKVVVLIQGLHYKEYIVYADTNVQNAIISIEEDFWKKVVSKEAPAIDASDATAKALSEKFARFDDGNLTEGDEAFDDLCKEYQAVSTQIKELEVKKQAVVNQIKGTYCQTSKKVLGAGFKASWVISESTALDSEKLKNEFPQAYEACQYSKTTDRGLRINAVTKKKADIITA